MERPEILFPLFAELETLPGIGPRTAESLSGLGVLRPKDVLFLLPHSGTDRQLRASLRDIVPPTTAPPASRSEAISRPVQKALTAFTSAIRASNSNLCISTHVADQLQRLLPTGQERVVSGKVEMFDNIFQMVHPITFLRPEEASQLPVFEPIYPLVAGVTQRQIARRFKARWRGCRNCRSGSTAL